MHLRVLGPVIVFILLLVAPRRSDIELIKRNMELKKLKYTPSNKEQCFRFH